MAAYDELRVRLRGAPGKSAALLLDPMATFEAMGFVLSPAIKKHIRHRLAHPPARRLRMLRLAAQIKKRCGADVRQRSQLKSLLASETADAEVDDVRQYDALDRKRRLFRHSDIIDDYLLGRRSLPWIKRIRLKRRDLGSTGGEE